MNLIAQVLTQVPNAWWMPSHPDAIYGAAIGGAIAALTAILTNRNARKRQSLDLQHSSEESDKARSFTLKRETYLPLVESMSGAVSFVMQLSTAPFEQVTKQEPLMLFSRQVARLSLIAPAAVQEPLQRGFKQLMQTMMALLNDRMAVESISGEIATKDFEVQLRLNRQKELLLRQEKHIDARTADKDLMNQLSLGVQQAGAEVAEILAAREVQVRQRAQMQFAMQRKAASEVIFISEHACEALIAIRNELEMITDEDWVRRFTKATAEEMSALVFSFQNEIEARILSTKT